MAPRVGAAAGWRGAARRAGARPGARPGAGAGAVAGGHSHGHSGVGGRREQGVEAFLDGLKWNADGLVVATAQDASSGALLMQAFADREAVRATLETGRATFWSRSREELWVKGLTSGHFIEVAGVYVDCDRDSLVYQGLPLGPACHTGAPTCFFERVELEGSIVASHIPESPETALAILEGTIAARAEAAATTDGGRGGKPSWTERLLADDALLCSKVREEAGELCATLEDQEDSGRVASEMADLLYHSMVLLRRRGVSLAEVDDVLRSRFGVSGVEEKAARVAK